MHGNVSLKKTTCLVTIFPWINVMISEFKGLTSEIFCIKFQNTFTNVLETNVHVLNNVIYLLTEIGLTPGGSSTVHIYTQTIHRATQLTQTIHRTTQLTNWEECGPCSVFESCILAFALQLREKHGKPSVRVAEECQLARRKQNIQNRTYITIRIYKHKNKNTELTELNKTKQNIKPYTQR